MPSKRKKIDDLNRMYNDADAIHKSLMAEQRSNILLVAGNHYAKRGSEFWKRLRNNVHLTRQQRLRLTKNHIQKITKTYVNNLLNAAPGVSIMPKNPSEYQDQKAAELNQSVWSDIKERHNHSRLNHLLAKDFIEIGEAWLKIFFDPKKGQFLGFETKDDENGNPRKSKDGEYMVIRRFTGDLVFERIFGFNVLTDTGARSWEDLNWLCYRKMVDTRDLKDQFKDDEDKLKMITSNSNQTWMLFDGVGGEFRPSKDQTMIREYYIKPNSDHENGYYYITTETGILFEGELPHGIFPIVHVGFDEATTSARSFSIIKQLRPYQAEVNRSASKIAEHQITLGDDKIVTQAGASVSAGGTAHGVKHIKVSGPVQHLPGRSGEQYLGYMQSQIEEMYFISNTTEDSVEKATNLEPYAMLFRSMRDKKKFSLYAEKFERFLKEICKVSLQYAKEDYSDDMVIRVLDKKERVNIKEFKNSDDLAWQIKVEPASEDVESKMGRQIALNHILQFAGQKLDPEDMGKVIKAMPFVNSTEIMDDLTIDADNVRSDILSMDRGTFIPASPNDNHKYYIRRLNHRMKKKDFQFLPPAVQSNYQIKLDQHTQIMDQQVKAAAAASAGFVPTGGFLVTADVRVPDPVDPKRTKRAQIPVEAIAWLLEKLEQQGLTQNLIQTLPPNVQASLGGQAIPPEVANLQQPIPDQGVA